MNIRIAVLMCLAICLMPAAYSQPSRPVSRISETGILETLGLEVKFNCAVLNPERGVQYVSLDDISGEYEEVKTRFEEVAAMYGQFQLIKEIPGDIWGDTLKPRVTDGILVRVVDMSQLYYLQFSDYIPVDEVIAKIAELQEVAYAHPPAEAANLTDPPNDPRYVDGSQWNLANIGAEEAWSISHGLNTITIAIIESEDIPYKLHPDLVNKWDSDKGEQATGNGDHGARVAGIIGAETNNNTGIASLGWNLKMSRYYFYYQEPPYFLAQQIDRAVAEGNRVINCSFVTVRLVSWATPNACTFRLFSNYQSVADAISRAIAQGVVVVAGSGNSLLWHFVYGPNSCLEHLLDIPFPADAYPAAYPGVIAVSATGEHDLWAEGQNLSDPLQMYNYRPFIDVAAPGMYVLTTEPPNTYTSTDRGTSFSTPHVSALAGLVLSVNSSLLPAQVNDMITSTTDKVDSRFPDSGGRNDYLGYGRINAYRALSKTNGAPSAPQNVQISTVTDQWGYRYPKVTWGTSPEADVERYEIWRKVTGNDCGSSGWTLLDSTLVAATVEYTDWSIRTAGYGSQCTAEYKLRARDAANLNSDYSSTVSIGFSNLDFKIATSVETANTPTVYALHAVYPNPFNPSAQLNYDLPEGGFVSLAVYDVLGRKVAEILNEFREAGFHSAIWNAMNKASGLYMARLTVRNNFGKVQFSKVSKLMLLR